MTRIIEYLTEHFREQPSLQQLADVAGLSPTHFHREFQRWTGISPKDFAQHLTHRYAREQLDAGASVLSSALASGLSGPSRLHDLCLSIEGATPGTIKRRGEGLTFRYGTAPGPFGYCAFAETDRGLSAFEFTDSHADGFLRQLKDTWPAATFRRDQQRAKAWVQRVFRIPEPKEDEPLRCWVRATGFQLKVWRALLRVPSGQLVSYQTIGSALGHPQAARAIGTAVGANPIAVLIPCHRVIRQTGTIQGYRWGSGRKRALIAWEQAQRENPAGHP